MDWIKAHLLALAIGALPVGIIASLLFQGIKRVLEKETALLDKTPAAVQRIYFGITAMVITAVGTYLGVPIVCPDGASCLNALNSQSMAELLVQGGLAIVTGLLTHKAVLKKTE